LEWYVVLTLIFVALLAIMFTGLPIAFTFMLVSTVVMFAMQGEFGVRQLVLGMYDQVAQFSLTPIPFFTRLWVKYSTSPDLYQEL